MIIVDTCPPSYRILRRTTAYDDSTNRLYYYNGAISISCTYANYAVYLYRDGVTQVAQVRVVVQVEQTRIERDVYLPLFDITSASVIGEKIVRSRVDEMRRYVGMRLGDVGYVRFMNPRIGYIAIPTPVSDPLFLLRRVSVNYVDGVFEFRDVRNMARGLALGEVYDTDLAIDVARLSRLFGDQLIVHPPSIVLRQFNNYRINRVIVYDHERRLRGYINRHSGDVLIAIDRLRIGFVIRGLTNGADDRTLKSTLSWGV